jgi:chaperonin GroES
VNETIWKGRTGKMKIKPLHDRILVQRVEEETKTKGGIIIPDTAKEKPAEGKVVAVGSGRIGEDGKRLPLEVKTGDRVLFSKYGGTEVKVEGEEYLIMKEDDVLGIID